MKELTEFWDNLSSGDKHLDIRYSNWGNFIYEELISRVQEPINTVLDYGCGGGWTLLDLPNNTQFYLFDICEESLNCAETNLKKCGKTKVYKYLITDVEKTDISFLPKIDILLCMLVINHLPSYAYYKEVINLWKRIAPKYIVLHQRHSDKTIEYPTFEEYKKRYGKGLSMSTEDTIAPLKDTYKLIYWTLEDNSFGHWRTDGYEFFILKVKK